MTREQQPHQVFTKQPTQETDSKNMFDNLSLTHTNMLDEAEIDLFFNPDDAKIELEEIEKIENSLGLHF